MSFAREDSTLFGFESEAWLEQLRQAEAGAALGRLGSYELLGEAGRGGQGVVFRARQPGTGREIALKRLLAGTFASAAARRRFEREVEAVTALSHPGIVTVYGVDVVEGAPLLAMEWIEGEPVTEWAARHSREEVLALFLLVCDAVQHAHQRGVLHRDLKPSNVVVDPSGRPRVLDFGLAKVPSDPGATVSTSGEFVGTPAYAAPEQWRGTEVDARADVYSLGALLYEMLTGRRVLEGDALAALAHAEHGAPPRPSTIARSIPRELDAIVLQALAHERDTRYQSVDALSGDVRRFLAGEPVLAHPPGAWYLLRKLVARNRLATGLVVTLLVATLVYALLATRQARSLAEQRNRAVAASTAESLALAAAVAEKQRVEEEKLRVATALAETERERQRAREEGEKAQAALDFLLEDVIAAADPVVLGHEPTLVEILRAAAPKVEGRFGKSPAVEILLRTMLSDAFFELGHYPDAEVEMRRSLELRQADPASTPVVLARGEHRLGRVLQAKGEYEEAQALLRAAVTHFEASVPLDSAGLAGALDDMAGLYMRAGRSAEAIPLLERALQLDTVDRDRNATLNNLGAAFYMTRRFEDARAAFEETLAAKVALSGENSEGVASLLCNLATLHQQLGDLEQGEQSYRRALAIETGIFGDDHPSTAATMGRLAQLLAMRGEFEEAEDLARRSLAIYRRAAPGSIEVANHAHWLASVLSKKGDDAQAEAAYAEALALYTSLFGSDHPNGLICANNLGLTLTSNGKLDEAEELLVDVAERRRRLFGADSAELASTLHNLADVYRDRGELAEAEQMYDEVIAILTPIPAEREQLVTVLKALGKLLRQQGETERAAEIDRRVTGLDR